MNYSKEIRRAVYELTSHYAKFDSKSNLYSVTFSDISEFDLNELAAMLMSFDQDLASEANGPDNLQYETIMLPALNKYLLNPTSKEYELEFSRIWKDGVTKYFHQTICELIHDEEFNMNNEKGLFPKDHLLPIWRINHANI